MSKYLTGIFSAYENVTFHGSGLRAIKSTKIRKARNLTILKEKQ